MTDFMNCPCCGALKPECVCWSRVATCSIEKHRADRLPRHDYKEPEVKEPKFVGTPRVTKERIEHLRDLGDALDTLGDTGHGEFIREAADDLERAVGELSCITNLLDGQLGGRWEIAQWVDDLKKLGWVQ